MTEWISWTINVESIVFFAAFKKFKSPIIKIEISVSNNIFFRKINSILLPYQFFRSSKRAKNKYLKLKEFIVKKEVCIFILSCVLTKKTTKKWHFWCDKKKKEIYRQNCNSLGKVNRECLFFVIRKTAHRLESQSCKLKHKALISWSASSVSEP